MKTYAQISHVCGAWHALHLSDDNAVIIRPSGTEPKIKLYITSVGKDKANATEICEKLVAASKEILGIE